MAPVVVPLPPLLVVPPPLPVPPMRLPLRRRRRVRYTLPRDAVWHDIYLFANNSTEKEESDEDMGFGLFD